MKLYSIEGKPRWAVGFGILVFANFLVVLILQGLKTQPELKKFFEIDDGLLGFFQIADIGIFAGVLWCCFQIFDRVFWKLPPVLKFLGIPDLNGQWIGTLDRTEFPGEKKESGLPVFIEIRQTYLRMSLQLHNIKQDSLSGITRSDNSVMGIESGSNGAFRINGMFESKTENFFGANTLELTAHDGEQYLQGEYVSSFPRKGKVRVDKLPKDQVITIGTLQKMKSLDDEIYYGVPIAPDLITRHRTLLQNQLQDNEFATADKNRSTRDGLNYHMTLIAPQEVSLLNSEQLQFFGDKPEISLVLEKVGQATRGDARAFFVTVSSPHGDYVRKELGLPKKDFHVTLGFNPNDIHDHEKNNTTWLPIERSE